MLRRIVEKRDVLAVGFLDDVFQGFAFEAAILEEIIGVRHVGA